LERDLFQALILLNTRTPDAIVADIFQTLVSISLQGSPVVSARAKRELLERFDTMVETACSF
jgi:hypothetical protein